MAHGLGIQAKPLQHYLSVLVMDIVKIHHGDDVLELADRFGVRIEYLLPYSPYSPDLNSIGEAFQISSTGCIGITNNTVQQLRMLSFLAVLEVLDSITEEDAHGYLIHAGYFYPTYS
ncbi:hypothetical protein EDD15DRAFT_2379214 [Pisolithus albus]|nr:hypothetical protein EDD15DRAFT_2379214 [Pisolithus albus]